MVYKLNRAGKKNIVQGKVVDVSSAHIDHEHPGSLTMVIDVTLCFDGKQTVYVVQERSAVIYTPTNEVISTDLQQLLQEVSAIKQRSEEAIKAMPEHEQTISECDEILEQWNPSLREKRETDRRITAIEDTIGKLQDSMNDVVGMKDSMSELLRLMKKKTND